jgi:class 3 adenylate cyclase/tetratricopeptide (TPR) repeat protein
MTGAAWHLYSAIWVMQTSTLARLPPPKSPTWKQCAFLKRSVLWPRLINVAHKSINSPLNNTMHHLTPRFILDKWEAGERFGRIEAATIFVDISGFTAVTEALMEVGIAGGEMLADIMVAIFEPLIATVYGNGGFISDFAGDAFMAIFPDTATADSVAHAVQAAWQINRHLVAYPTYDSEYGSFDFAVKVGVAHGALEWGIVGNADGLRTHYFRGPAIDGCAHAEHQANGGDVLLAPSVVDAARPWSEFRPIAAGYFLVESVTPPASIAPIFSAPQTDQNARAFIAPALLHTDKRGEFRDVVSIFVNVSGSPKTDQLVPFIDAFFELLMRYEGTLCRLDFGDKGCNLLLFWGAPASHENDIQRALDFALDLQDATDLTLRMGVTYRRAYAGFAGAPRREEYTCYGLGVNLAARQMMVAEWHTILLDDAVAQKATGFDTRYVEHKVFKGFAEPQPIYMLTGRRDRLRKQVYAGQLVGRERELAQLDEAFRPIFDHQCAGLITLIGEAGLGKSRLANAFLAQQPVKLFLCQADEILRQSLNPFRFWLRHYFGQSTAATQADNRAQFNKRLDTLLALTPDESFRNELQRTRSFLAALIDIFWPFSLYDQLEPELRFENTLSALKTLIKAESMVQPVVVLLEDVHWLDADSAEFLKRLMRNVTDFPFVVLATSREPLAFKVVEDSVAQTTITLGSLGSAALSELVADRLAREPSQSLITLLDERTDGNPFFVEQMLLYLQENELLDPLLADEAVLEEIIVPTDVRAVLVSRLDRLEPVVRDVVQQASVLGREFQLPVLRAMVGDTVETVLNSAESAAVWRPLTETRYLFQHALMRDAAYDMQLRGRLRNLHNNAAHAYECLNTESYFTAPPFAEIAYHFDNAREVPQAVDYYGKAGEQAKGAYHNEDAVAYFSRGIELSERVDDVASFTLLSGREAVLSWIGDRKGQLDDLQRLSELVQNSGGASSQADIELRTAYLYHVTGQYDLALPHAQHALKLADQLNDDALRFRAYHTWGRILWKQGLFVDARPYLHQALAVAPDSAASAESLYDLGVTQYYQRNFPQAQDFIGRASADYDLSNNEKGKISCSIMMGLIKDGLGQFSDAQQIYIKTLTFSRTIGWRYGEAFCLEKLSNNSFNHGDFELAQTYQRQALQVNYEIGHQDGIAVGHDLIGLINLFDGELAAARKEFRAALDIQEHITRDRRGAAYTLTHLGRTLTKEGLFEQANAALLKALDIRADLGKSSLMLDTLAALAECEFMRNNSEKALSWAHECLEEAKTLDIESAEFPSLVFWILYFVLKSNARTIDLANDMLKQGYDLINRNAQRMEDAESRHQYLTRFPFHQLLSDAWHARIYPDQSAQVSDQAQ